MATDPVRFDFNEDGELEPQEWEECPYDAGRLFRAVLIAIPIGCAMWAGLIYLAFWIARLIK